jgi:2-polyprenyl-3-methyl-5-hydroxy-6-metoxy-1,4-benzoquinol methylase
MNSLAEQLALLLPAAELQWQSLNYGDKHIELALLAINSEGLILDSQQVGQFWQQLPYWAFAWAAGQGLARHILTNPELVQGKRVLDFGCGSGLVGIAAAKAGAKSVICCDTDPYALIAAAHNAKRNGVEVTTLARWSGDSSNLDCLLAADILYDLTSAGDLANQCANISSWLVAETQYQLPPWSSLIAMDQYLASTLPKLEDFDQDLAVSIYRYNKAI